MVRLIRLIATKGLLAKSGLAAIMVASVLSIAFQPALASAMTSPQCSHASAMENGAMANHADMADQMGCCSDNVEPGNHDCGNFCVISCANSTAADIPLSAVSVATPSRPRLEARSMRPLLQLADAFIPPPPRT